MPKSAVVEGTEWAPTVYTLADGDTLSKSNLLYFVQPLTDRTNFLYRETIGSGRIVTVADVTSLEDETDTRLGQVRCVSSTNDFYAWDASVSPPPASNFGVVKSNISAAGAWVRLHKFSTSLNSRVPFGGVQKDVDGYIRGESRRTSVAEGYFAKPGTDAFSPSFPEASSLTSTVFLQVGQVVEFEVLLQTFDPISIFCYIGGVEQQIWIGQILGINSPPGGLMKGAIVSPFGFTQQIGLRFKKDGAETTTLVVFAKWSIKYSTSNVFYDEIYAGGLL